MVERRGTSRAKAYIACVAPLCCEATLTPFRCPLGCGGGGEKRRRPMKKANEPTPCRSQQVTPHKITKFSTPVRDQPLSAKYFTSTSVHAVVAGSNAHAYMRTCIHASMHPDDRISTTVARKRALPFVLLPLLGGPVVRPPGVPPLQRAPREAGALPQQASEEGGKGQREAGRIGAGEPGLPPTLC